MWGYAKNPNPSRGLAKRNVAETAFLSAKTIRACPSISSVLHNPLMTCHVRTESLLHRAIFAFELQYRFAGMILAIYVQLRNQTFCPISDENLAEVLCVWPACLQSKAWLVGLGLTYAILKRRKTVYLAALA